MSYFYSNGHNLHYREKGKGNLLLILPGNTASSANHIDDLDYFGEHFHAVSLDLWGTGKSDRLKDWTRNWWIDCAKDAINLIEYLNSDSAYIIGCSGGVGVGLLMAALYPDKVKSVIADSEIVQYKYDDMIKLCIEERKNKSKDQVDFWKQAHGDDWENVIHEDNNLMLDLAQNGHIFKDKFQDITCPVLFCGSLEADQDIPYFSETLLKMTKAIKNANLFLTSDGNHPLMWTCQNRFRKMALSFFQYNE
ncbi:MAG: hypothetical protein H6Q67_1841 [Firmicutes bacterium]|nr:hypothetical protein [Bacillota bacterium]